MKLGCVRVNVYDCAGMSVYYYYSATTRVGYGGMGVTGSVMLAV